VNERSPGAVAQASNGIAARDGNTIDESAAWSGSDEGASEPIPAEEYVRWAYRLLLGREPESRTVVRNNPYKNNRELLVRSILSSEEFKQKYSPKCTHPFGSWEQEAVAFIHIPKTGGTTLHTLLSACFHADYICPERYSALYSYPPLELAKFNFFSGHFDFFSVRFIPRRQVRSVSIFRDPYQRLISCYRFLRTHPMVGGFAGNVGIQLAHELGPEEFFEHPVVASLTDLNNAYLFYFGSALEDPAMLDALVRTPDISGAPFAGGHGLVEALTDHSIVAESLARAVKRVGDLTAIGLTERFEESVELIFAALGLPRSGHIAPQMVTDELPNSDATFSWVPPVTITPRLARALQRLTRYDLVIYGVAKHEFERRLNKRSPRVIMIPASSLCISLILGDLLGAEGVIKYDAARHGRPRDQPLIFGPYLALPSGQYQLSLVGEVVGTFRLVLTAEAGGVLLHQQMLSSRADMVTFAASAPAGRFEVLLYGTDASERLSLERIILTRA
jgi:hypothetical protein